MSCTMNGPSDNASTVIYPHGSVTNEPPTHGFERGHFRCYESWMHRGHFSMCVTHRSSLVYTYRCSHGTHLADIQ